MSSKFFSLKRDSVNAAPPQKQDSILTEASRQTALENEADLPPVVARMVVEIRSDGSRTIARGALEDLQTGEKVSLQANADSPVALAKELTKSLLMTPTLAGAFAKQAVKDLIPKSLRSKIANTLKPSARKKTSSSRKAD